MYLLIKQEQHRDALYKIVEDNLKPSSPQNGSILVNEIIEKKNEFQNHSDIEIIGVGVKELKLENNILYYSIEKWGWIVIGTTKTIGDIACRCKSVREILWKHPKAPDDHLLYWSERIADIEVNDDKIKLNIDSSWSLCIK